MKKFDYKNAASNLRRAWGENPDKVIIYTICTHVAKSGMSRDIKALCIVSNDTFKNEPWNLGWGRIQGCGMDVGFEAAYHTFCVAYPDLDYRTHLIHRWL